MSSRASASPDRDVVEDLVAHTRLPFGHGTPSRDRRTRRNLQHAASPLQSATWNSPMAQGPDRSPWHASRIVAIVKEALQPTATVEALLRGTNSLFLCASESEENRHALRAIPSMPALLSHLYERSDVSHSGARVKEHTLNTVTLLLGTPAFDEAVAFDDKWLPVILPRALLDRHASVVLAAARLARRVSEVQDPDAAARQLTLNDETFEALLRRHETCEDITIRVHLLCALVNIAADDKVKFFLARCQRLLQILLDEIFAGGAVGARVNAADFEASVLGETPGRSGSNRPGGDRQRMRSALSDVSPLRKFVAASRSSVTGGSPRTPRSVATSVRPVARGHEISTAPQASVAETHGALDPQATGQLDLCELALRTFDNLLSSEDQCAEIKRLAPSLIQAVVDCRTSPSDGVVKASKEVLKKLHDLDSLAVERELSLEVLQGRATTNRLRSPTSDKVLQRDTTASGSAVGGSSGADGSRRGSGVEFAGFAAAALGGRGRIDIPDRVGASTASSVAYSAADDDDAAVATTVVDSAAGNGDATADPSVAPSAKAHGSSLGSAVDLVRNMLGY